MQKPATLKDMIAWAKDRLVDDIRDFMTNYPRVCFVNNPETEEEVALRRMCALLALPDDAEETLAALSVSYWNGCEDTYWEHAMLPSSGFVGFNRKDGLIEAEGGLTSSLIL